MVRGRKVVKTGSATRNRIGDFICQGLDCARGPFNRAKACFRSVIPLTEAVAVYVNGPIEGERLRKGVSKPRSR